MLEARYAKDVTEQTKDYTESLTLSRRIFLIGCIQHDMIAFCEPVVVLYRLITVTLAPVRVHRCSEAFEDVLMLLIASGGGKKLLARRARHGDDLAESSRT